MEYGRWRGGAVGEGPTGGRKALEMVVDEKMVLLLCV